MEPVISPPTSLSVDPFAGAVLPALAPVLQLSAVLAIITFLLRKIAQSSGLLEK